MYKIILLISVLGIVLYKKNKIVEPIVASCCGGVKAHENNPRAPKKIRRCLKNEEWYMPCTNKGSPDCCSGEDRCIPSRHGGMCHRKDGSGHYIYDGEEQVEYNRSEHDREVDDDDGNDDDNNNYDSDGLNIDQYLKLDYLNYLIIICVCFLILYLIYHLFFEKNITEVKYKTRIHHHDYGHSKYGHSNNSKYGHSNHSKYGSKKYSWQR